MACALAGAALVLVAAAPLHAAPAAGTVWDEAHLLGSAERAALARLLRAKAAQSGSPLSIVLVPHLAHDEAIDALARRTFADKGMDAPGPPQVLLAVATHERRAAIETGQGPAGIVPEIDAGRITRRLEASLAHHHLASGLEEAVAAIAASARATADRRRPSPPDPLDEPAPAARPAQVDVMEPGAAADAGVQAKPDAAAAPAPQPPEPAPPGRSLLPTAALVSAVVVLGLALRRRRRFVQERPSPERRKPPPGGPPKGR